jgi:hypothetical protein
VHNWRVYHRRLVGQVSNKQTSLLSIVRSNHCTPTSEKFPQTPANPGNPCLQLLVGNHEQRRPAAASCTIEPIHRRSPAARAPSKQTHLSRWRPVRCAQALASPGLVRTANCAQQFSDHSQRQSGAIPCPHPLFSGSPLCSLRRCYRAATAP